MNTRCEHQFSTNPEATRAFYQDQGYHIEYNVLSPEECDALIQQGHALPDVKENHFRPYMQAHRTDPLFARALKHKRIVEIMSSFLGGKLSALQTEFFFTCPGTHGFANHQDNKHVEAPYGQFASAWIPLVDVSPQNGGLTIYPGSHKEGIMPIRELHQQSAACQDPNALHSETIMPAKYQPLSVTVPRGSVLFFDGHTVHSSHPNQSDGNRYVLLCTYIREGAPFRPGKYAQRKAEALDD